MDVDTFGRELRKAAVFLSDNMDFAAMMSASSLARRTLTYFVVSGSAVIQALFWNTKNEVIQDFFPGLGIVFCIAVMIIGEREYNHEKRVCRAAIQFRREHNMSLGTLVTRFNELVYTKWYQISKLDFVATLTAISWVIFGIGFYSMKG